MRRISLIPSPATLECPLHDEGSDSSCYSDQKEKKTALEIAELEIPELVDHLTAHASFNSSMNEVDSLLIYVGFPCRKNSARDGSFESEDAKRIDHVLGKNSQALELGSFDDSTQN